MIFNLFRKAAPQDAVFVVYNSIVAQSRRAVFYAEWGVPDTVTGRFDMISLHLALLLRRLKAEEQGRAFGQELVNLFFSDMDRSLREMGVTDLGVPRKVRNMGNLFYGIVAALDVALGSPDKSALAAMLRKNVYPDDATGTPDALADYLRREVAALSAQPVADLISGRATGAAA